MQMYLTLAVLLACSVFFVSGRFRSDLVAVCSLVWLLVLGILTPAEALSGFSNPVVVMMIGLFVVGGGIFQTGLAKMISSRILKLANNNETKLLVLVMCATAFIGAFVSNTGTVALMLPIVVSMAMSGNINTSRLLMPLAFASSMGGMMTLIGTPPNLVINDELLKAGYQGLTFFSFTPVGILCLAVGLLFLVPMSGWLLVKKPASASSKKKAEKSLSDLVSEYQLSSNLYRIQVEKTTTFANQTLREMALSQRYGVSVLEIRRKSSSNNPFFKTLPQEMVGANSLVCPSDILYLQGSFENINQLCQECQAHLLGIHDREENNAELFDFNQIGIAEVLVMPTSKLVNIPIAESCFREHFGLNILGVQRQKDYLLHNLKDEKIHAGDILLVQGSWENIHRLGQERASLVVLGEPLQQASKVTLTHKAPIAALIMILMVVLMILDLKVLPPVVVVMIASILMVLTGALRNVEAAYKTINWESIVLIAAMIPMATALEKTGASALISRTLVDYLGNYSPYVLLSGVYFTTSLMTMFISNTATAILLSPIALSSAVAMGVSPYPFLFAVAVGASMCFASPFSTPPNALVMSAGRYTFMDYVKVGLPLQILMGIVMIVALSFLFPF